MWLLPAFLRHGPPGLRPQRPVPVVFTIHNLAHQGIAGPELAVMPGVADALNARLVAAEGFEAIYMTGAGTSASRLGMPDVGLLKLVRQWTS